MKEYTGQAIYSFIKSHHRGIGDPMYDSDMRFYNADEVDAERAKDKEEIARLRKALEWYRCNSLNGGEKAIEALEGK